MDGRRRRRRGAALLEAVIALGVLGIGTAAVVSLVNQLHRAGTKATFQTASLDLFAAFSAQVRAASCDLAPQNAAAGVIDPATTDDGLEQVAPFTYAGPSLPNSAISLVGDFIDARQIPNAPPMRLTYQITQRAVIDAPPILEIDVIIREITRDPARDDPTIVMGPWIRNFRLTKVCAIRADNATGCVAGVPPCGRGEFY